MEHREKRKMKMGKVRGMRNIKTMSTRNTTVRIQTHNTNTFKAHTLERAELLLKKWLAAKQKADMIWSQKERELEEQCKRLGILYGEKE
jgi:hypothetical protein